MAEWIAIAVGVLMSLAGLAVTFGYNKRRHEENEARIKANDELTRAHIASCEARHINTAKLEQQVTTVTDDVKEIRKDQVWLGDSMITIGTAMSVKLPQRPQ